MIFTPRLQPARLLRRYKRFLADVQLPNGEQLTVHCPNTGSMKNCIVERSECWLSLSHNPKRKYAYTWELATTPTGHLACINTQQANKIVAQALAQSAIAELASYTHVQPEVKYGTASRIDFLLAGAQLVDCYVEVKSVTLLDAQLPEYENVEGLGCFPDAVSARGQKHLQELMAMTEQGQRAVLLFCVMHAGITAVAAAHHIDPTYAALLKQAQARGVELLAYACKVTPEAVCLTQAIPVLITG